MSIRRGWFLLTVILALVAVAYAADGAWLKHVPAKDHERTSPHEDQADAIAAGGIVFSEHCAQCHGEDAQGKKRRPSLRSARVQQEATEGDLHWLLVNGNMARGMPSWSKLGDPQIWQVIRYVKSLGP
jgi:cytochrome c oxidase cbb3-type subunit 2